MNAKSKTRETPKGGKVLSVTVAKMKVDIYSRVKRVKGREYQIYEVADFSHGTRRMRCFSNLEKAQPEAETIARRLSAGDVIAAQLDSREPMMTSHYNTSSRPRRETFPDGSQLVRRSGGSYEIIEARPKYEIVSCEPSKVVRKTVDLAVMTTTHFPPKLKP